MSWLEALLLGILQGLTEFFPISSSGHLTLLQHIFGWEGLEGTILFDLVCHWGTLLAVFFVFWRDILSLNKQMAIRIFYALLPLLPAYFLLHYISSFYNRPECLGYFFLVTALFLFLGEYLVLSRDYSKHPWRNSIIVGIFQVIALLPGVSRSGSTVSAARVLGLSFNDALRFSFLLAIPTIIGGSGVELVLTWDEKTFSTLFSLPYIVAFLSSFIVGYLCLFYLAKQQWKRPFLGFAVYVLCLGVLCIIFL